MASGGVPAITRQWAGQLGPPSRRLGDGALFGSRNLVAVVVAVGVVFWFVSVRGATRNESEETQIQLEFFAVLRFRTESCEMA